MSKRLIGSDGKLVVGTFGATIDTGTLTVDVWYLVTVVGGSSVLPTNAVVGYLYKADGTEDFTASGDEAKPWTGTDLCDVQSWGLDMSKAEAEVTTMCDNVRVYRAGKTDVTGNLEGVFTIGVTNLVGGFQNQFVTIVKQDDAGTPPADYVISLAAGATVLAKLYVDKTVVTGESEGFYYVPISLTGFSAAAGGEDAQTFTAPFRVAPSASGEAVFAFYEYVNQ